MDLSQAHLTWNAPNIGESTLLLAWVYIKYKIVI